MKGGLRIKNRSVLIGREDELKILKNHFQNAVDGKGSTVLLSGEAGIGKSRLLEEFRIFAEEQGVGVLAGAAMADMIHPFLLFSSALEGVLDRPLFHEQEYTSFAEIFAVNRAGLLAAKATPEQEEGLDADIFAGMLSAVQDFVRDSFESAGQERTGLGRLEYGDMKILIEHGEHLFLTAVFKGAEHPDMKNTLKKILREVEDKHGETLDSWSGHVNEMRPVQDLISQSILEQ